MLRLIHLSFAAAAIALFVTQSELLDPVRRWLPPILARGSRCGLCMSAWGAAAAAAVGQAWAPLDLLATWGAAALLVAAWERLTAAG